MYEIKAKKHFKLKASNFSGEGVTIADIDPIVLNTSYQFTEGTQKAVHTFCLPIDLYLPIYRRPGSCYMDSLGTNRY